jgi:hypothetical protein
MSLLKKFSKSTQDLREKKKWRLSTLKPRKKREIVISRPQNCQHVAGLDDSGGVFSNSDVSCVPLVRKADIMIMKNKTEYDELESLRLDVGKMDMVDDVLSVMDKYVARKEPTSTTYLDRNSLGNTTDYSDTESRSSSYLTESWKETRRVRRTKSRSVPNSPSFRQKRLSPVEIAISDFDINLESPISLRQKSDEISQKDSFYSTTDISQCETDREVAL